MGSGGGFPEQTVVTGELRKGQRGQEHRGHRGRCLGEWEAEVEAFKDRLGEGLEGL